LDVTQKFESAITTFRKKIRSKPRSNQLFYYPSNSIPATFFWVSSAIFSRHHRWAPVFLPSLPWPIRSL